MAETDFSASFPQGVYTVLVTPFLDNMTVDMNSISDWYIQQCKTNVTGVVLLGTTSEVPTLTHEEQYDIVKSLCELKDIRITEGKPVKDIIIGIGGNDTYNSSQFCSRLRQNAIIVKQMNGIMVTVPSYNKPTQEGIYQHFKYICDQHSTIPVIIYNVPSRTGVNMTPDTIQRICASCPNVIAIKEASGSMDQVIAIRSLVPHLKVFSGDDKAIIETSAHGGCGVISVASNVIPHTISKITNYCLLGNFVQARQLYYGSKIPDFVSALFCETNPIPVKYMMMKCGLYKNARMRLPMTELSAPQHKVVDFETDRSLVVEQSLFD